MNCWFPLLFSTANANTNTNTNTTVESATKAWVVNTPLLASLAGLLRLHEGIDPSRLLVHGLLCEELSLHLHHLHVRVLRGEAWL